MSKKLLLLLIVFVLLLCSCVTVIMAVKNPSWFTNTTSVVGFLHPKTTPAARVTTSISLNPFQQTILFGQQNTIAVVINAPDTGQESTPHIIQLELSYDPNALTNITITPGNFFQDPTIDLNLINPTTGRISYALSAANKTVTATTGTIATITFTPNPEFLGKQTRLSFLPKTTIKGVNGSSIGITTYGTQLIFTNKDTVTGL